MLTEEIFRKLPIHQQFASGTIPNSPEGIYMTNSRQGDLLRWVAIKGSNDDWTIYTHWVENDWRFIMESGDKVTNPSNVKKLVECSPEVFNKYRL